MKKKKTIIFAGAYFCAWNGGVKLLKICLDSLLYYDKRRQFNYILLVPDQNILSLIKRIFYFTKVFIHELLKGKFVFNDWPYHRNAKELRNFFSHNKYLKIVGIDYRYEKKFLEGSNNINFLSMNPEYKKNKIGYLFDFQHKYFPNYFSKKELHDRDDFFLKILNNNDQVIVNSIKTKKDALKYYKKFKAKIIVLPFTPYLDFDLNCLSKKKINLKNYFIVCNHFWKHKNFETLLKSFKILKNNKINLVITGQVSSKNFKYFLKIKNLIKKFKLTNNVKIFTNLEKKEQLRLLNNSIALIQPTLFEGGPGGFSVYEAISLGKPSIVSDIDVNKEIKNKNVFFFKKNNSHDLSYKILKIAKNKPKSILKSKIIKDSKKNKLILGKYIFDIIKNLINKNVS